MVSIIIPVYNVAPYIEECLKSVMQQTYDGAMECLIVDDCGTDNSIPIAERMIAAYSGPIRFEIFHHEQNRGLSAARNTGTLKAKGEYIYYLDSDDYIMDGCIEKLMAIASADSGIEMIQGKYCLLGKGTIYPIDQKNQVTHAITNQEVRNSLFLQSQLVTTAWNTLIKRSFILEHHLLFKEGILYEDLLWRFYLMKHVNNVYFHPDVTFIHKRRPGSICTGTDKRTSGYHFSLIYQEILSNLTPEHEMEEFSYYTKDFAARCLSYRYYYPAMKDVFLLYWEKAKQLKCYSICILLALEYGLGRYKYGWLVLVLLRRLKHPSLIPHDFKRIWLRMKRGKA